MSTRDERRAVHALARAYGVETSYVDGFKQRRTPPIETLIAVLRALGAPIERAADATAALRAHERAEPLCDPVAVAWEGTDAFVGVRSSPSSRVRYEITHEDGRVTSGDAEPEVAAGAGGLGLRVRLPRLPLGYHTCRIEAGGKSGEVFVISAPKRAPATTRRWGVFAPVYAFGSARSWGAGDLTDLSRLAELTASLGGSLVGTLPLLASFLDEPFDPSPYAPVSRLFWNELYLDVDRVPEARAGDAPSQEKAELQRARLVDYRAIAALKRSVLEPASQRLSGVRRDDFERYRAQHPELTRYATFRAACEQRAAAWTEWAGADAPLPDAGDPSAQYHAYVQWLLAEQLGGLVRNAGAGLYLDLPLGVHGGGYDTWRFRDAFAQGVTGGAPPDTFFNQGQNWGSPPLHPHRMRTSRYEYPIACVRELMRYASALRIDHMMGLHRLFWIPRGADATGGTYVRYPADELYAILTLEANRHDVVLVGEDLGTVPPPVRPAMARHRILRSYVLHEELRADLDQPLRRAPRLSLATTNTHDMPTFASFWSGDDVDERVRDGLLSADRAEIETKRRAAKRDALLSALRDGQWLPSGADASAEDVLGGVLRMLSAGQSSIVLVPLEDLWLEREPQNRPGSGPERANWSRKARHGVDELPAMQKVTAELRAVDELRAPSGRRRR